MNEVTSLHGLKWGGITEDTGDWPRGCFQTIDKELYFNTNVNTVTCDRGGVKLCVCKGKYFYSLLFTPCIHAFVLYVGF